MIKKELRLSQYHYIFISKMSMEFLRLTKQSATLSYTGNFIPIINIPPERWVKNYD